LAGLGLVYLLIILLMSTTMLMLHIMVFAQCTYMHMLVHMYLHSTLLRSTQSAVSHSWFMRRLVDK